MHACNVIMIARFEPAPSDLVVILNFCDVMAWNSSAPTAPGSNLGQIEISSLEAAWSVDDVRWGPLFLSEGLVGHDQRKVLGKSA